LFPGTFAFLFALAVQLSFKDVSSLSSMCVKAWSKEYLKSVRQSLYPVSMQSYKHIHGQPYRVLVKKIYQHTSSIVMGLKRASDRSFIVTPIDCVIHSDDLLFILSRANNIVTKVIPFLKTFGLKKE
jgi:hypothetical protein